MSTRRSIVSFFREPFEYLIKKISKIFNNKEPNKKRKILDSTDSTIDPNINIDRENVSQNQGSVLAPGEPVSVKLTSTLHKEVASKSCPFEAKSIRIPDCVFLFIGLDSSGITSTMLTTFNLKDEKLTTSEFDESESLAITEITDTVTSPSLKIKIIDVPGFCKEHYVEQDAQISLGLQFYLIQSIPNKIPNVVFIVTRFDDNRFEGNSSEFSKMLIALSHSQRHWMDGKYSNILLVLTHGSKIPEDEKEQRIKAFQDAFHNIFPKIGDFPVNCIVTDNNCSYQKNNQIQNQSKILKLIATKFNKEGNSLKPFFENFNQGDVKLKTPKSRKIDVQSLQPSSKRQENQLIECLLEGTPFQKQDQEEKVNILETIFFPYPVKVKNMKNHDIIIDGDHNQTWLPPTTKIVMADGSTTEISMLFVGDKIMNKDSQHTILTSIFVKEVKNGMGRHFVSTKSVDEKPLVLKYISPGKIRKVFEDEKSLNNLLNITNETRLYSLQLNYGQNETFIADNFVMQSSIE